MSHRSGRWFHHHLNGAQAENLLMDKGVNGSFLARPSESTVGNFTLSVRRGNAITHIRIQNSGDFLDLYGGEKFATLHELVAYYMENEGQLKEKNGDQIDLKYPLFSEDPTTERWFHGRITGKGAEKLLLEKGKDGSFLVRESMHQPDSYVLSVVTGSNVSHIMIHRRNDGKFDVGGGHEFTNLKALIDFYTDTPMPINATRFNVSTIEKRMKQLERENARGNGWAGFLEEFEEMHHEAQSSMNSRNAGSLMCNREKNRYKNILPFDATQVKLREGDPNDIGSTYINANYIKWPEWLTESLSSGVAPRGLSPLTIGTMFSSNHQQMMPLASKPSGSCHNTSPVDFSHTTVTCADESSLMSSPNETSKPSTPGRTQSPAAATSTVMRPSLQPSSAFLFSGRPRYIATQGTLGNTLVDFWRMVWQEKSVVIVMITKEVERGRNKCVRYWPSESEKYRDFSIYGGHLLRVSHVNECECDHYIVRELHIQRRRDHQQDSEASLANAENQSLEQMETSEEENGFTVWHYHFTVWPDHGTPDDPSCVLDYMDDISMRQDSYPEAGPMIVHCSAGIGRTGTFIIIDMLINHVRTMGLNSDVDIARTIQAAREQRSGMVQTESQYRFIYRALQQYVYAASKRIQMDQDLRHTGRDYTNINRRGDELGISLVGPNTAVGLSHSQSIASADVPDNSRPPRPHHTRQSTKNAPTSPPQNQSQTQQFASPMMKTNLTATSAGTFLQKLTRGTAGSITSSSPSSSMKNKS